MIFCYLGAFFSDGFYLKAESREVIDKAPLFRNVLCDALDGITIVADIYGAGFLVSIVLSNKSNAFSQRDILEIKKRLSD